MIAGRLAGGVPAVSAVRAVRAAGEVRAVGAGGAVARGGARRWRTAVGALALGLIVTVGGCGAPAPGTTTRFDPTQVPFGLLSSEPAPPGASDQTNPSGPSVWFVRRDKLVEVAATTSTGSPLEQAQSAIRQLQAGPTSQQQSAGLSNLLPPDVELEVRYVVSGVANVRYMTGADSRPGADAPLMTGQIVLTITSVPGVDAVIFDNGKRQVEAPLPGGALTDDPVSAASYQALVAS